MQHLLPPIILRPVIRRASNSARSLDTSRLLHIAQQVPLNLSNQTLSHHVHLDAHRSGRAKSCSMYIQSPANVQHLPNPAQKWAALQHTFYECDYRE